MSKFKTWKEFELSLISAPKRRSIDSFFRSELFESRMVVRNVINERSKVDLSLAHIKSSYTKLV